MADSPPTPDQQGPRQRRRAQDTVLAAVTTGHLTLDEVLTLIDTDDSTGTITVTRLLAALPGVTPDRVDELLARLDLAHTRRLGSLDALERVDLRALQTHDPATPAPGPATVSPPRP